MATPTLPADKFDTSTTFITPANAPTRAPLEKLAVLPGFNTRVKDDEYAERVKGVAESIVANGFFNDKPFAVTMLPNDDTIYIYDGEHRFDAARQATLDGAEFPEGLPIAWAKDGATVKDLTIHLAHGNNGERLNMVELAAVVRRMQGLDMTKDEIAAALGRTARHVENLFVLAAANQQVKKAVASGKIAGAEAVKLLRKDPKTAASKIAEAVKKAEEKGKAKATPKTMTSDSAPKGPKMKTIEIERSFPEGEKMGDVLKALATQLRAVLQIDDATDKLTETGTSVLRLRVIDREAEAEAERKAKEKADAAAAKAAAKEAEQKLLAEAKKGEGKAASEAKTPKRRTARPAAEKVSEAAAAAGNTESAPTGGEAAESGAPETGDSNNGL